jgi:TM2 domain-containing membrane protein YozV
MSDQPPELGAQPASHVSPDGQWIWNGTAWVPNPAAPPSMLVPYSPPAPMPYAQMAYPSSSGYAIAPKNPAVSLIVSFFLPGVGSMINGDVGIGLTILLLWILGFILDVTFFGLIVGVPLGIGMFVWGLIDAYQGAQRWNARHGIIS